MRRARAQRDLDDGIVVSFVGETCLPGTHVYVDSGRRYDFRFALDLVATIVVCPGVDARASINDLFLVSVLYPTVVDFERQLVASVIDATPFHFRLWPKRTGSAPWREVFAA